MFLSRQEGPQHTLSQLRGPPALSKALDLCLASRSLQGILGDPHPVLGTREGLGGMLTRGTWRGEV